MPSFAEDWILDQGRNNRRNLEPEHKPLSKGVFADNRVFRIDPDIYWSFSDAYCPSDEETDGHVPFVPRGGLVVVSDRRIRPYLPSIRQIVSEGVQKASPADVGCVHVLAAATDFLEVVREEYGSVVLGLVTNDNGRTEPPLIRTQGIIRGGRKLEYRSQTEYPVSNQFFRKTQQQG